MRKIASICRDYFLIKFPYAILICLLSLLLISIFTFNSIVVNATITPTTATTTDKAKTNQNNQNNNSANDNSGKGARGENVNIQNQVNQNNVMPSEDNTGTEPSPTGRQQQTSDANKINYNLIIHPSCGQTVQGNVKLSSNLICSTDGIEISNSDTIIDLNGFSIKGPGPNSNKVGIMIGGHDNVTVKGNGIISGFQSAIHVAGSNIITIKDLNLNNNKVGLYMTGSKDIQIYNNMITNNSIGIASHSSNQTNLKYNQLSGNKLSGITFINTVNSLIKGNNILNTTNGVFIDTQSSFNNIDFNNVFNNVLDLNNANNLPININNNYYSNNNCILSLPSGLCIGR